MLTWFKAKSSASLGRCFFVITLVIVSGTVLACSEPEECCGDGYIQVYGKVYEWINAPADATSKIYIGSKQKSEKFYSRSIMDEIPTEISKMPLEGANVMVTGMAGPSSINFNMTTNTTGEYHDGDMVSGGAKATPVVEISKYGYLGVTGRLYHGGVSTHEIVAILVKENEQ